MRILMLVLATLFAGGCSTVATGSDDWIEPVEAIRGANDDPTHGVRGKFVMTVRALDSYPERSFLNSEQDYRDQRNLTVRMPTSMLPELEARLGVAFADLKSRRIVVEGVARRARIDFVADGRPTGKYYYQTHVLVDSPTQISFAE